MAKIFIKGIGVPYLSDFGIHKVRFKLSGTVVTVHCYCYCNRYNILGVNQMRKKKIKAQGSEKKGDRETFLEVSGYLPTTMGQAR